MRLAVLEATGSVGREFVSQALAAGHQVTALVRGRPVVSALGQAKGAPGEILARASTSP
jgi:putative NADH-flavin reductase